MKELPPHAVASHRSPHFGPYAWTLVAIVFAAFVLRVWDVGREQHFQGDQGRDYLAIMDWLQDGNWPLLGQFRSAGDYTIGPGWYYTIALPLALSGYRIAAGAAWMAIFSAAAIAFGAVWVRRGSGSQLAALAFAFLWASAAIWDFPAKLWNPSVLPFATVALAWLIQSRIAVRPQDDERPGGPPSFVDRPLNVRRLAVAAMVLAVLPHWHTTGILVAMAAAPCLLWSAWRWRDALRKEPRGVRWRGIMLVGIWILLLYVPPAIEAVRNDGGNLVGYWTRTTSNIAAPANSLEIRGYFYLATMPAFHTAHDLYAGIRWHRGWEFFTLYGAMVAAMVAAAGFVWRRRDPSLLFLLFLCGGYGVLGLWKNGLRDPYFYTCTMPVPMMFAAVAVGRATRCGSAGPLCAAVRLLAFAALLWFVGIGLRKLPTMIEVAGGRSFFHGALARTEAAATRIRKEVEADGGAPFSLHLAEPGNFSAALRVFLRRKGLRPANADMYTWDLREEDFGEALYLVTQGVTTPLPVSCIGRVELLRDWQFMKLWRVRRATLPKHFERMEIRVEGSAVLLRLIP